MNNNDNTPSHSIQAHSARVEQLRLQRLEAEFKAAEKARRERAVHRHELAIRDAFMQVRRGGGDLKFV